MFRPEGVYVAQMTPFEDDGSVSEGVLRRMVDFVIDNGVDGIFPVSSIGESALLGIDEKKRMIDIVVDQTAGRVPVTPGTGDTCPDRVIPLTKYAKEAGCSAVVICPPYYYRLDQDMVRRHFEDVAAAVDIPIVLYNIPIFANPIAPETVAKLSEIPNIVGIKDSGGDAIYIMEVLERTSQVRPDFSFLTGRDETLFTSLSAGARGGMIGTSGFVPEIAVAIYDRFRAGDLERARQLQFLIPPIMRTFGAPYFPVALKAGLEARGFNMGPLRLPVTEEQERAYRLSIEGVRRAIDGALARSEQIRKS